jgi:hypothetical protein
MNKRSTCGDFLFTPFCTILKNKEWLMTVEQMVEIPANRRIYIELPPYIPEGKAMIAFSVTPACAASLEKKSTERKSWRSFRGMFKDSGDTTADFLERMRTDRELEDAIDRRHISSEHG